VVVVAATVALVRRATYHDLSTLGSSSPRSTVAARTGVPSPQRVFQPRPPGDRAVRPWLLGDYCLLSSPQKHEPLSLRNRLEMPFSLSPPYQSLGEHNPEELLVGADVLW
jgi:hypothetical protein